MTYFFRNLNERGLFPLVGGRGPRLRSLLLISFFLFTLSLFSLACSSDVERTELEQIGDENLRGYKWKGWALIDTCYYKSPFNFALIYLSCPAEAFEAQNRLFTREYNAVLDIDDTGASNLKLALSYPLDGIIEYSFPLPPYTRSDGPALREDVPVQFLTFDTSALAGMIFSGELSDFSEIRLEQQPETLLGGMDFYISRYPVIEVPTFTAGGFTIVEEDVYFMFSLLLKRSED